MVNSEGTYCNAENMGNCKTCIAKFRKIPVNVDFVSEYQDAYFNFLNNIADKIIVFSNSTKNIYLRFYPNVENKIQVIPHTLTPLRKVKVEQHEVINIAVLGNITLPKGSLVLKQVDKIIQKHKNLNLKLIGKCNSVKFKNIKVLGSYKIEDLPDIMEQEQIDIVFIPSICPETFSYTASEALSMGIPIACFNIGAPVEKITQNINGIVISTFNCEDVLTEIEEFIKYNNIKMKDE